jgi:hypothetical protein
MRWPRKSRANPALGISSIAKTTGYRFLIGGLAMGAFALARRESFRLGLTGFLFAAGGKAARTRHWESAASQRPPPPGRR